MEVRPRLRRFLVVALLAHAGVLAWSMRAEREIGQSAALRQERPQTESEITLQVEPASSAATPAQIVEAAPAPVRRPAEPGQISPPPMARGSSSREATEAPAGQTESPESGSWSLSPAATPASGSLSSAALENAIRAGVRVTVEETQKNRSLRLPALGGFGAHDIELGLVPGGEFVTLARETVRTSVAPTVGNAVLEFQTDGAGSLISVRVVDASSNRRDWEQAAAEIAKAARGHRTRVPHGGQGIVVTVDVTSAMKTVSGASMADGALTKVLRAIDDPIDAVMDGTLPAQHVVTAHIVDVQVL